MMVGELLEPSKTKSGLCRIVNAKKGPDVG